MILIIAKHNNTQQGVLTELVTFPLRWKTKQNSSVLSDFSGNCSSVCGQRFSLISHCLFTGMQASWDQDFDCVLAPLAGISPVPGMVPRAY